MSSNNKSKVASCLMHQVQSSIYETHVSASSSPDSNNPHLIPPEYNKETIDRLPIVEERGHVDTHKAATNVSQMPTDKLLSPHTLKFQEYFHEYDQMSDKGVVSAEATAALALSAMFNSGKTRTLEQNISTPPSSDNVPLDSSNGRAKKYKSNNDLNNLNSFANAIKGEEVLIDASKKNKKRQTLRIVSPTDCLGQSQSYHNSPITFGEISPDQVEKPMQKRRLCRDGVIDHLTAEPPFGSSPPPKKMKTMSSFQVLHPSKNGERVNGDVINKPYRKDCCLSHQIPSAAYLPNNNAPLSQNRIFLSNERSNRSSPTFENASKLIFISSDGIDPPPPSHDDYSVPLVSSSAVKVTSNPLLPHFVRQHACPTTVPTSVSYRGACNNHRVEKSLSNSIIVPAVQMSFHQTQHNLAITPTNPMQFYNANSNEQNRVQNKSPTNIPLNKIKNASFNTKINKQVQATRISRHNYHHSPFVGYAPPHQDIREMQTSCAHRRSYQPVPNVVIPNLYHHPSRNNIHTESSYMHPSNSITYSSKHIIERRSNSLPLHQEKTSQHDYIINKQNRVVNIDGIHNNELMNNNSINYSRKDKSLGLLCENFVSKYGSFSNVSPKDGSMLPSISIDEAAKSLGVERRRIYDIINILEAIKIVSRKCKNTYYWHGVEGLLSTFMVMQKEAFQVWEEDAISNGLVERNEKETPTKKKGTCINDIIHSPSTQQNTVNTTINTKSKKKKSEPHKKKAQKPHNKEKSLGRLSQKFIQLFLVGHNIIGLTDASDKILGPSTEIPSKIPHKGATKAEEMVLKSAANAASRSLKTKIRRLYDIANVMVSIGIIEKINCGFNMRNNSKNRPSFRWVYNVSPKGLFELQNQK